MELEPYDELLVMSHERNGHESVTDRVDACCWRCGDFAVGRNLTEASEVRSHVGSSVISHRSSVVSIHDSQ